MYRLANLIALDDASAGGKRCGKRGRGADGKRPVPAAVETRAKGAGSFAMQVVNRRVAQKRWSLPCIASTDYPDSEDTALPALNTAGKEHERLRKVTPPEQATTWCLWRIFGNMKKFIDGAFHGLSSHCLQEYLDEFCCRFNRRFWGSKLLLRLLNASLAHAR